MNKFLCWLCVKGIQKKYCIVCNYTMDSINELAASLETDGNSAHASLGAQTAEAQFEIGFYYYILGDAGKQNYEKAFDWFSKSAEQGYAKARLFLGECYDSGYGVKQDRKRAGQLFLEAAEQGLAEAQFRVKSCFMGTFNGFEYNPEKYNYWKTKAAEQGYGSKESQKDSDSIREMKNAARWQYNREELKRLNLNTIEDLENLMHPLVKDATKLIIKRKKTEPQDSNLRSHFGGQPYFEKGEKWPSIKEGDQFELIFQIFNTGTSNEVSRGNINLPENIKLIQFYYDYENSPISYSAYTEDFVKTGYKYGNGWLVKIYETINTAGSVIIERPEWCITDMYCEIKYEPIKSLPDSEWYDETVEMLCEKLDGESKKKNFDSYNFIAEKLNCEQDFCSQLGGYPQWLQGDATPDNKDYQLLFQLDSEDEAGLHWVDCGIIYVFYNPKTKETIFEIQYC